MRPARLLALLCVLLSGCAAGSVQPRTLTVFAAASLTEAFSEIGSAFEVAHPGTSVTFSFSGSQTLRTQIESGAPADVFAAANSTEMDVLAAEGMVAEDSARLFLSNQLVVILPGTNPAGLGQLEELSKPGVKIVLAAEEVPVGGYARQSLDKMNGVFGSNFKARVLANVVSNEDNVKQVVAKVKLGEADAGIVYGSDAVAEADLKTIEIPPELNVVARYPIAPLTHSVQPELARSFVEYVLSPAGQAVLQKWGFGPAD